MLRRLEDLCKVLLYVVVIVFCLFIIVFLITVATGFIGSVYLELKGG